MERDPLTKERSEVNPSSLRYADFEKPVKKIQANLSNTLHFEFMRNIKFRDVIYLTRPQNFCSSFHEEMEPVSLTFDCGLV